MGECQSIAPPVRGVRPATWGRGSRWELRASGRPRAILGHLVREDARELQTIPPPRAIPMADRAPRMGRHVGPEPQACVRDATSCEQLGAADGSFSRATRLGPSPNALWMGQKEASVQDTRSGYPRGGLARGADKASGRPHAPCARGRQAGCAKPSPKGAVRLSVPSRGKLHGGAPAASVRSRCDVLQAAVALPMGARALLRRSNRRGPTGRAMGESECAVIGASGPHGK